MCLNEQIAGFIELSIGFIDRKLIPKRGDIVFLTSIKVRSLFPGVRDCISTLKNDVFTKNFNKV